jgi:hypothetical protein
MRKVLPALLLLSGAATGLAYWFISGILRPAEPIPVTILYRFGDTDYLSLIYAVSRFQFHEFVTTGLGTPRWISFPPGLSMFYALPIAIFGDSGFPIGDALLSMLRMVACILAARSFTRERGTTACIALAIFVLTGPLPYVSRYWELFYRPLWDLRYLRPYVTGIFSLALIVSTCHVHRMLSDGRVHWGLCALQGVLIGLAAQGDFHLAVIATFASTVILATALIYSPAMWKGTFTATLAIGLACLAVMTPMLIEVIFAQPDALARLGQVTISRLHPPLLWDLVRWPETIALGMICLVIGGWRIGGAGMQMARQLLFITYLFVIVAIFAAPLSVIVLGRGIQMHHFPFRGWGFTILGLTIAALIAGLALADALVARRHRQVRIVFLAALATGLLGGHFAYITLQSARAARLETQQRVFPSAGLEPVAGYRHDLDNLWGELQKRDYQNADVLGTFNQQLGMLWLTRRRHHLWNPDPFLTTVDDYVIEQRVLAFAQLVQMSREEFNTHLQDSYFQVWFLGSNKWARLGRYQGPGLAVHDSEVKALDAAFANPISLNSRLDIVILERSGSFATDKGPAEGFRKTYENLTFTVWLKDSLVGGSQSAGN